MLTSREDCRGMMEHTDPDFTLRTYTYAAGKMQQQAAAAMRMVLGEHLQRQSES